MKKLPKTVLVLGIVSFFNDLSSEMIYPLLPVFLATVLGTGALALGVVEGVAESAAALLKVVSGALSDRLQRKKPFILGGYGLSGFVRPLIGLAVSWPFVLAARFLDRVGKGLRTSPRDALIADATPPALRGRAYGFHRAMDHGGAVAGPLVAAALLSVSHVGLRHVFLLAAIPAAVVFLLILMGVRDPGPARKTAGPAGERLRLSVWKELDRDYRRLLLALVVFTLGNSTDAFILLRLSDAGVPAAWIAVLWSLHHVVKSGATYLGGRASDRLGRKKLIVSGWVLYGAVYLAFALVDGVAPLVIVFLIYGIYYGLTEPCEKAWVADLAAGPRCGTAFGFYHGAMGIAALPASILFGWVWQVAGIAAAFGMGAALALLASLLLPAENILLKDEDNACSLQ